MKPCTRVGINCTKRCNWKCQTCFYRWAPDFNTTYDKSVAEVMNEAIAGKNRGCDHVVFVGWGEPGIWPNLIDSIKEITKIGMTSSIITNGSVSIAHYAKIREAGLNHLHISVHGIGETLDKVSGVPGSGAKQLELFKWLKDENWPWRMNMTVQQANYVALPYIARTCIDHGCRHIIPLGFLPHYEWNDPNKLQQVAVHPAVLRPHIESVASLVEYENATRDEEEQIMLTIRYHPMCHLNPEYRKYVVNAKYVVYDPWEWDYEGSAGLTGESLEKVADKIGNSVAINEEPCTKCGLRMHCGGWNKVYAAGFGGASLQAWLLPEMVQHRGWLHDQNPANHGKGWF